MRRPDNMLQVAAAASQATAGSASGTTAIPNRSDGVKALRVAIKVVTATELMYFRPVLSGGTVAASNGIPIDRGDGHVIVSVAGFSHIAAIRGGSADVTFQIIPLED